MIHIIDSAACDRDLNWIQLDIFTFFVSLNYYCKPELLVRIYLFLCSLIIEVIQRLLEARLK